MKIAPMKAAYPVIQPAVSCVRKIADEIKPHAGWTARWEKPCFDPSHNVPSMMVFSPGTYEHTCPGCGKTTVFHVHGVYC